MVAVSMECALFEVGGVMQERRFDAPLTGETESGKSTVLEAVWWTLGVKGMQLVSAAAECGRVGFAVRVAG